MGNSPSQFYDSESDLETPISPYRAANDDNEMETAIAANTNQNSTNYNTWHITDFNNHSIGPLSRDGSVHVTDEVFNSSTHLAATMLSILGTALIISIASSQGNPWKIVSMSIYGASLIFLFAASTLHHMISASEEVERTLRMLDYVAIYPLIAGTFTPMCLVFFHDSVIGWSFFGSVWLLSLVGMMFTIFFFHKMPKWMSMTMYITLGWLGALMAHWLLPVLGYGGMSVFILGGLFYTLGGVVFTLEVPNPIPGRFGFHEIWHIAVILGAATHWCLIYFFILPWEDDSSQHE